MVDERNRGDFKHELFAIILSKEQELIERLHSEGKLKFYAVRIVVNLVRQKRNVYTEQYLKPGRVYMFMEDIAEHSEDYLGERIIAENEWVRWPEVSNPAEFETRRHREAKEIRLIEEIKQMDDRFNTPYYRMLVDVVAKYGSMREASRVTGISVSAISRGIKKIREHLNKLQ